MKSFSEFPTDALGKIRIVLTDIDDTLTTEGQLPAKSLEAIEKLSAEGIQVIPVTGRPAGWCDHIARMWAVAAVVGENGALYYSYDRDKRKMISWHQKGKASRRTDRETLKRLSKEVLAQVPGTAMASDQPYRISDVAIDFCEDVKPLPMKDVHRIKEILEEGGATVKISSIHVNAWLGEFDKLTTAKTCLSDLFNISLPEAQDSVLFIGDSPNDEPMFDYFKHSIGVSNVLDFPLLHPPKWVTKEASSGGFAQVAKRLIKARQCENFATPGNTPNPITPQ